MDQVEVTRQVPVWETQARERRYAVLKPVTETSMREERYTVQRPVYETVMRDASYNVVRNVTETAEREERYIVQKPVTETVMREERYIVQKPVTETMQQTQYRTVMRPVTTYTTQYADQGCYQDQVVCSRQHELAAACRGAADAVSGPGYGHGDDAVGAAWPGCRRNAGPASRPEGLEAERRGRAGAADFVTYRSKWRSACRCRFARWWPKSRFARCRCRFARWLRRNTAGRCRTRRVGR